MFLFSPAQFAQSLYFIIFLILSLHTVNCKVPSYPPQTEQNIVRVWPTSSAASKASQIDSCFFHGNRNIGRFFHLRNLVQLCTTSTETKERGDSSLPSYHQLKRTMCFIFTTCPGRQVRCYIYYPLANPIAQLCWSGYKNEEKEKSQYSKIIHNWWWW